MARPRRTGTSSETSEASETVGDFVLTQETTPVDTSVQTAASSSLQTQTNAGMVSSSLTTGRAVRPDKLLFQTTQYDQLVDKSTSSLGALAFPTETAVKAHDVSLAQATASAVNEPTTLKNLALTEQRDAVRDQGDTSSILETGTITVAE